jgi:two-component system, OmpR family, sensor kinase
MRTLTARVVALVLAVVLSSTVITGIALARVSGSTNAERALVTLRQDASLVAAAAATPRAARARDRGDVPAAVTAAQRRLARSGIRMAYVAADGSATVLPEPFTQQDVSALRAGTSPPSRRSVDGQSWLIAGAVTDARPADTVLVAQQVRQVVRLTDGQRRRLLVALALGLIGGGIAGLLLARGVTVPLGRVAAAARRMSAGEREVRVAPQGPTEVADLALALNGLSQALASSEQRQRAFLLNVSHELRTPLTAVTGYAEALADGALPAHETPRAAGVIREEAVRLQHRVEDLLALARMEADDFRLEPTWVDVGVLLRAAADAHLPRAVAAGVGLRAEAPADGPFAWVDGERLRQAVDALADNALRVLPAGAPLVFAASADAAGTVRVEVRDGGPGLAPEDLAVAFERGRLQERYRGSRPVGSGLGLALVGELTRRMGGHAEASPAPEGGACFAMVLPVTGA